VVVLYDRDVLEQSLGRKVGVLYANGSTPGCCCRVKAVEQRLVVSRVLEYVRLKTDSARTIPFACAFYEGLLKRLRV
jgi:hypothetical protein